MPNHVHGIIVIHETEMTQPVGASPCGCPRCRDAETRRGVLVDAQDAEMTKRVGASLVDAQDAEMPKRVGASLVDAQSGKRENPRNRATTRVAPTDGDRNDVRRIDAPKLGDVVGGFKSLTTVEYGRGVRALVGRRSMCGCGKGITTNA